MPKIKKTAAEFEAIAMETLRKVKECEGLTGVTIMPIDQIELLTVGPSASRIIVLVGFAKLRSRQWLMECSRRWNWIRRKRQDRLYCAHAQQAARTVARGRQAASDNFVCAACP